MRELDLADAPARTATRGAWTSARLRDCRAVV